MWVVVVVTMTKIRSETVRIPENPKPETIQAIKKLMRGKTYKVETYTPTYGWNALIPVTHHKEAST